MLEIGQKPAPQTGDLIKDATEASFMADVIEACEYLETKEMPATEPERKVHDHQRRRC